MASLTISSHATKFMGFQYSHYSNIYQYLRKQFTAHKITVSNKRAFQDITNLTGVTSYIRIKGVSIVHEKTTILQLLYLLDFLALLFDQILIVQCEKLQNKYCKKSIVKFISYSSGLVPVSHPTCAFKTFHIIQIRILALPFLERFRPHIHHTKLIQTLLPFGYCQTNVISFIRFLDITTLRLHTSLFSEGPTLYT